MPLRRVGQDGPVAPCSGPSLDEVAVTLRKYIVRCFFRIMRQPHAMSNFVTKAIVTKSAAFLHNAQREPAAQSVEIGDATAVKASDQENSSICRIPQFDRSRIDSFHLSERSQCDQSICRVVNCSLLCTKPHLLNCSKCTFSTTVLLQCYNKE